jgi:tetratricopeptide (TPR) repeat protein
VANAVVNDFCLWVSQELEQTPALEPLRKHLLRSALAYQQAFLRQRSGDPALRLELAKTHDQVGKLASVTGANGEAVASYRQALALYRELHKEAPGNREVWRRLPSTLINLSTVLGANEAQANLEEALGLYKHFLAASPDDLNLARGMANGLRDLGSVHVGRGRLPQGRDCLEQAVQIQERLARRYPDDEFILSDLASTLYHLGVLAAREPDGNPLALCCYLRAHELRSRVARARPHDPRREDDRVRSLRNLGIGLRDVGAEGAYQEVLAQVLALRQKQVAQNPFVPRYQVELSLTLTSLGHLHNREGRREQALAHFGKARDQQARLLRSDPSNRGLRRILGESHYHIGCTYGMLDRRLEEAEAFEQGRELQEGLVRDEPDNLHFRGDLSRTLNNLAFNLKVRGQLARARTLARQAVDNTRVLLQRSPGPEHRRLLNIHYNLLGNIERLAGQAGAAAAVSRERQKIWPNGPLHQYFCACDLVLAAGVLSKDKAVLTAAEQAERERYLGEAMQLLRRAVSLGFDDLPRLRTDPDLALLRDRADFRALLAEVEKKPARPAEKRP